ncbi:NXF3, partial [Cervus elaphus hippelaphus]
EHEAGVFTKGNTNIGLDRLLPGSSKIDIQKQVMPIWTTKQDMLHMPFCPILREISFGIKYDEKWLLNLIQKQCGVPFITVEFHYEKMQAQFFVENANIACALKNDIGKIFKTPLWPWCGYSSNCRAGDGKGSVWVEHSEIKSWGGVCAESAPAGTLSASVSLVLAFWSLDDL